MTLEGLPFQQQRELLEGVGGQGPEHMRTGHFQLLAGSPELLFSVCKLYPLNGEPAHVSSGLHLLMGDPQCDYSPSFTFPRTALGPLHLFPAEMAFFPFPLLLCLL